MKGEPANESMAIKRMLFLIFKAVNPRAVEEKCPTKSVGQVAMNEFEFVLVYFVGITERCA